MTPDQIEHCAQVALYTKVHDVRLMQAGADADDLAALFLDIFHARDFNRESLSTPEDAEALLVLVESGYKPAWARWRNNREGVPDPTIELDLPAALPDLTKTAWLWRIMDQLRADRPQWAGQEAYRFLCLREKVRALTRPVRVQRRHGDQLVATLCDFITDEAKKIERKRHHERPYLAPRRRTARRPGFRGLGF